MKTFSYRLKLLRGDASQEEMARKYGVSQPAYGKWENGKAEPKLKALLQICKEYGVSADWLLGLEDARTSGVTVSGSDGVAVAASSPGARVSAPASHPDTDRLLSIIESQQRVIENLSKPR